MAQIRVKREEGHYTLKRVPKLPKRGNANWLYAIIADTITELYRWNMDNEWETITIGGGGSGGGIESIQAGTNVTLTGTGTLADPIVVNATDTLPTAFEAFEGGIRRVGSTTTDRYTIGLNSFDGTLVDAASIGIPDSHAVPYGAQSSGSFLWGTNNKDEGDFENITIGSINRTNAFAYSVILGGFNNVGFGYGDVALGTYNTINPLNVNSFNVALGSFNTVTSREGGGAVGITLDVRSANQVAVGASNVPWTGAFNAADRPIFTVGIGSYTTPAGRWLPTTTLDGFNVLKNGVVRADNLTTALIDAEATGRVLITKEWFNANSSVPSFEGYAEVGTRPTGIVVNIGDHDVSNNGTMIRIDDSGNGLVSIGDVDNGNNGVRFDVDIDAELFNFQGGTTFLSSLNFNTVTANRQYTFADNSGTIPMSVNGVTANSAGDITISSGGAFEALNEGSGIGIIKSGRVAANFGNIGLGSTDLSESNGASTTRGATGDSALATGDNTTASGDRSFAGGFDSESSGRTSFAFGEGNLASGFGSIALNGANFARSYFETTIGLLATDYTPNSATANDEGDRIFTIGVGTFPSNRSDGFTMLKNGNAAFGINNFESNDTGEVLQVDGEIKSDVTIAEIDAASVKTVTTKEWVQANAGGAFEVLDEGSGNGIAVTGRNAANFGNIGLRAVDLTSNISNSLPNSGATGTESFATNAFTTASGFRSVAMGQSSATNFRAMAVVSSIASGNNSFSAGTEVEAFSYSEIALGNASTTYTPNSISGFDSQDRLFVIGNGLTVSQGDVPSDALTVLKNGNTAIGINNFEANDTGEKLQVEGEIKASGDIKSEGLMIMQGYTVASLPTGIIGARAYVTDATFGISAGFGTVVVGGGANVVPVFYDGTDWRIA